MLLDIRVNVWIELYDNSSGNNSDNVWLTICEEKKLWKYALYQIVPAHPCVLELHLPHHHLQPQPPARHCSYSRRWHGSVKKTWERIKQHDNFRCKRCSLEQRISRYAHIGVDGQEGRRSRQCLHPPCVHSFEVFTKTWYLSQPLQSQPLIV